MQRDTVYRKLGPYRIFSWKRLKEGYAECAVAQSLSWLFLLTKVPNNINKPVPVDMHIYFINIK